MNQESLSASERRQSGFCCIGKLPLPLNASVTKKQDKKRAVSSLIGMDSFDLITFRPKLTDGQTILKLN